MAKFYSRLNDTLRAFIGGQKIFFTATAPAEGRINLSPKGMDTFRCLDEGRVAYLDLTGSGNETAAHLLADGRLTLMFCAFEGPPLILRLYGRSRILRRGGPEYTRLLASDFGGVEPLGARQMVQLDIELVQTSCGYGVPLYEYTGERPTLIKWAEAKGPEGLKTYRRQKNTRSLDGLPTGLSEDE